MTELLLVAGGVLKWEQPCRLRHMVTRQYLTIVEGKIGLTDNNADSRAVFRLHPVTKVTSNLCKQMFALNLALLHMGLTKFIDLYYQQL